MAKTVVAVVIETEAGAGKDDDTIGSSQVSSVVEREPDGRTDSGQSVRPSPQTNRLARTSWVS